LQISIYALGGFSGQMVCTDLMNGRDRGSGTASCRGGHPGPWRSCGLLHRPGHGRSCGHPGQVEPPGAVFDEHQHVQPLEQHRFHHQEVAHDDRVSLGCQELPPGWSSPAGRRLDARGVQDLSYRGRRDHVPQPRQLTLDPPVAPGQVLPRHPDDQRLDRGPGGRPFWPAPAGAVPLAGDEVPVPAQDRGRQ
jgi:hypothetical protein